MINDNKLFFPYLLQETYIVDIEAILTNYPQRKFLGVLNTIFLNISNYLPHLELGIVPFRWLL